MTGKHTDRLERHLSRLEHDHAANTRSPQSRPHGAPACHLARPASLRVTAVGRQRQQRLTHRTGKSRS